MATKIPASFISNYVAQHGNNSKFAQATSPAPSPAPQPKPAANKPARTPRAKTARPVKKRHGIIRRTLGAVAGEVFRHSGAIGKHVVRSIAEDATGSGGMPTNNASSGAIAGLGTGPQEPGVKKGRKAPRMTYKLFTRTKRATDAGKRS